MEAGGEKEQIILWETLKMDKIKLNQKNVLKYIAVNQHVSHAELADKFEGSKGNNTLLINKKYDNIVIWDGISKKLINILGALKQKKKISTSPCSPLIYILDGVLVNLDIATKLKKYKKPRWLPVTYSAVGITVDKVG